MICFVNTAKTFGGGEKWHLDIAKGLHAEGVDVIAVSYPGSPLGQKLYAAGVKVFPMKIGNLSFLNPIKLSLCEKFFRKLKVDTVIMNLPSDMKFASSVAAKVGAKKIIYRRGSDIPIKNSLVNRYYFGSVLTDVIANSEATKKSILAKNPALFPIEKIKVIYNGIDFADYPKEATFAAKAEGDTLKIGTLGRLVYQKAQTYLLDLSQELQKRNLPHKIIIGGDGPEKAKLVQYAENAGVAKNIEFVGFVENVPEFMSRLDVFALTSRWEGFGYVLVEAMACGRPLVAFDVSSVPEIIEDGENAYLVPFADIKTFADRIENLQSESERKRLGEAGFRISREKFSYARELSDVKQFLGL